MTRNCNESLRMTDWVLVVDVGLGRILSWQSDVLDRSRDCENINAPLVFVITCNDPGE